MSLDPEVAQSAPPATKRDPVQTIESLLRHAVEEGASDLHLHANDHPRYRIDGELFPDTSLVLSQEELLEYYRRTLRKELFERYLSYRELDF